MRRLVLGSLLLSSCTTVEPTTVMVVYIEGGPPDSGVDTHIETDVYSQPDHVTPADVTFDDGSPVKLDATEDHSDSSATDARSEDASIDIGPDGDSAAPIDAPVDTATEPPACSLQHLGDGCEDGVVGWLACCPNLVCQQGRCVDPLSGVDGATPCPCHCQPVFAPDGGIKEIDCTHGGCGCLDEGPVQQVSASSTGPEDAVAMCPALWVSYGPYYGCNTVFIPKWEGNQAGGSCKGKSSITIQCAPCYTWKPC